MIKRRGPRTEHWGTPLVTAEGCDSLAASRFYSGLCKRENCPRFLFVPVIPESRWSKGRLVTWCMLQMRSHYHQQSELTSCNHLNVLFRDRGRVTAYLCRGKRGNMKKKISFNVVMKMNCRC